MGVVDYYVAGSSVEYTVDSGAYMAKEGGGRLPRSVMESDGLAETEDIGGVVDRCL